MLRSSVECSKEWLYPNGKWPAPAVFMPGWCNQSWVLHRSRWQSSGRRVAPESGDVVIRLAKKWSQFTESDRGLGLLKWRERREDREHTVYEHTCIIQLLKLAIRAVKRKRRKTLPMRTTMVSVFELYSDLALNFLVARAKRETRQVT